MDAKMEALVTRLEAAVKKLETLGVAGPAAGGDEETEEYPQVMAYDSTFYPKLDQMMAAAKAIDPEVEEMSSFIQKGFVEIRRLILCGARCNKPDDMNVVLKPIIEIKEAGFKFEKDHFRTKWVIQQKAFHEALSILDWPQYGPAAANYVGDMTGAVECYTNKIAMQFRGVDENQMKWVQGLVGALKAIPEYLSDYHKTGLS